MHNNTVFAQLRRRSQKRETPSKRKEKTRNLQVHFLIMCEGKSTEPNYFKNLIKDKRSAILTCKIQGAGKGTIALIEETSRKKCELEKSNSMEFDRVWAFLIKMTSQISTKPLNKLRKKIFVVHGVIQPLNYGIACISKKSPSIHLARNYANYFQSLSPKRPTRRTNTKKVTNNYSIYFRTKVQKSMQ